ncbi:hypothetical protein BV898_17181 [Hypsibius exemplaris]|uniref:BAG domain-containing protein n=1 Tax=Hypsibius exemplaris TaxID=2072580 RepID=A0A9X6NLU5_HYPEX|nr:hypothetical protein BV898_17181 [Hypsibius exemplaris]
MPGNTSAAGERTEASQGRFETGHDSAFNQPPFKIPKEDERSAYVRNIPIFQESPATTSNSYNPRQSTRMDVDPSGNDENLIHQTRSAIPRPVPPPHMKSTSSNASSQQGPSYQKSSSPPATHPKPKNPVRLQPSDGGSDSGIDRAASNSPNENSDGMTRGPFGSEGTTRGPFGSDGTTRGPFGSDGMTGGPFGSSLPRFGFNDRQQRAGSVGRGGLWGDRFDSKLEKERKIPVKVENIPPTPPAKTEAIPMGYTKERDPNVAIPLGFERSSSAPGEKPSMASDIDRQSDLPKPPKPSSGSSTTDGPSPPDTATTHRVPIVVKSSELPRSASAPPKPSQASPPPPPPSVKVKTPLERIEEIMAEVRELEVRINKFSGARTEYEFKLVDELLTHAVIKLDGVATDGVEEVRTARKVAVKRVHELSALLESKAVTTTDGPKGSSQGPTVAGKGSSPGPTVGGKGSSPGPTVAGGATTRIVIPMGPDAKDGGTGGEKKQH